VASFGIEVAVLVRTNLELAPGRYLFHRHVPSKVGVTRRICEKIVQNVAQPIFGKITFAMEKVAQKFGLPTYHTYLG
jgi:hypothetical protein